MKTKISVLFLLAGVLFLLSCKKDEEIFPKVETIEARPTSSTSCFLKGSITQVGSSPVVDFGFVYSSQFTPDLGSGVKVSLGRNVSAAPFEKEVTGLMSSSWGRTVTARAYLTNEKGTVYGSTITVTLPVVSVTSIAPNSGRAGDRITISGSHFGDKSTIEVKFANATATVAEATPSTVVVLVPSNISTNNYYNREIPVTVKVGGQQVNGYTIFNVIPTAKDFSPKTGTFGSTITITGDNLPQSSAYYGISVSFGNTNASITQFTPGSMTVVVPAGVTEERLKVRFTALGQTTELPGEFVITPPTISSVNPAAGLPGSSFTISGTGFNPGNGYYGGLNTVKLGTQTATITSASASSITATVPTGLALGNYPISVSTGVHTVTAAQEYTVESPKITGFFPASGTVGTEVVISGSFSGSQYSSSVLFGSVSGNIQSMTASTIRVLVPSGVSSGKMKISVTTAGQTVSSAEDFTVLAPVVTGFSPASGVPGTLVTISGTGFSPNTYSNTVSFGTVQTTITQATATSITAIVPSNVAPGSMKISVRTNGLLGVSQEDFTVTQ